MASEVPSQGQFHLHKQDLSTLDVSKLTALSPEVISRQATINIGTIGHVAHGKSTVVKAISGVQTVRFKNELERNITIKLGEGRSEEKSEAVGPAPSSTLVKRSRQPKKKNKSDRCYKRKKMAPRKGRKTKNLSNEEPEWIYVYDTPEAYEVEKIVDSFKVEGQHWFEVKWSECEQTTLEPLRNLLDCQELLIEFFRDNRLEEFEAQVKGAMQLENRARKLLEPTYEMLKKFLETVRVDGKIDFEMPKESDISSMLELIDSCDSPSLELIEKAKTAILARRFGMERKLQLKRLEEWEHELNAMSPDEAKVTVENNFDLEIGPEDFSFVTTYIPINVNFPEDPPIGCSCSSCSSKSKCCNEESDAPFAYKKGLLCVPPGTPIYECNDKCKCGKSCENRVVQKGRQFALCIFRTFNECGWGLKTKEKIRKGAFITSYVGEIITNDEAEKRGRTYDAEGLTYLFDLDFNDPDNCLYTVDATRFGNLSHFVNHSCNPNCAVYAVWINCLDPNLPYLAIFASRDIEAEEEITFDYTCQYLNKANSFKASQSRLSKSMSQDFNESTSADAPLIKCKCGAQNCRKYLF